MQQQNDPIPLDPQLMGYTQPPPKKSRKLLRNKWFWIAVIAFIALSGIVTALSGGNSSTTPTSNTATQATQQATQAPTTQPTQAPTISAKLLEATYKASTTTTTVSALDKNGNTWKDKDVHFTAVISGFVKDDSGNTAGANVDDPNGGSGVIQIAFPPNTDISRLNQDDTIEIWGLDGGTASGQNAFGATVQEVVVSALYLTDKTTGYQTH